MVSGIWLSYLVLMLALMLPGLHRLVQSPTLLLVLLLIYNSLYIILSIIDYIMSNSVYFSRGLLAEYCGSLVTYAEEMVKGKKRE